METYLQGLILCLSAYFLGSIPSAYLVGRRLKGIDIRLYGSGNVGGSNVWHNVAKWAIVPVGLFDIGKATFVAWLAFYPLDLGYGWAVAAGLSAFVGHTFSIWLDFTGGRGVGCILGTLIIVFPAGAVFLGVVMVFGYLTKHLWTSSAGLLTLPILSLASGQPVVVTWGTIAMILLTAVKRLEANRAPLPDGPEKWQVIGRRLWLDRDFADHRAWTARRLEDK